MISDEKVQLTNLELGVKIPVFDEEDPRSWKRDITNFLRMKQRAHLGLLQPPAELGDNPTELEILRRRQAMEQWETRNDMAYAYIMNAVRSKPTARQVADTYDEAPNSRQNSGELMELLVARFTRGTQTTIEDWIGKYNSFSFKDGELPTHGIDRLKDLVQKLQHLGAQQSEVSQVERIKNALLNDARFTQLTDSLAVVADVTLDMICAIVKHWEDHQKRRKQLVMTAPGLLVSAASTAPTVNQIEDMQKCYYCKKFGHVRKDCPKRRKEVSQRIVKRDVECYRCGKRGHVQKDCRVKIDKRESDVRSQSNEKKRKSEERKDRDRNKSSNKNPDKDRQRISKFLKVKDGRKEVHMVQSDDSSISSSVSMVEEEKDTDNFVSTMSIEEQLVFIDSCASQKLFIVADASYLERVDSTVQSSINLTKKSAIMEVTGTGSYGDCATLRFVQRVERIFVRQVDCKRWDMELCSWTRWKLFAWIIVKWFSLVIWFEECPVLCWMTCGVCHVLLRRSAV
jgi:hypothetical protein